MPAIHLYGPLGERYGQTHHFAVSTPVEALRALDANHPGFLADFARHEVYGLYVDGDWRGGDDAGHMPFNRELHICPAIEGQAPLGAMLVGALVPALAGTLTATILGAVLMAGVMFGLSYLLMPKVAKAKDSKKDDNYAFSGPENVTGQGVAVPLIYGRVHAGSVVVSFGLDLGSDLAATVAAPAAAPVATPPSTAVQPGLVAPPGGFPPIVNDSKGRPGPQGWKVIGRTTAVSDIVSGVDHNVYGKIVDIWQHPNPGYATYFYNRVRGFYSASIVSQTPDLGDWYERGGHD